MAERTLYNVKVTVGLGATPVLSRSYTEVGFTIVPSTPSLLLLKNKDGDHIGILPVTPDTMIDCEPVKIKEILKPEVLLLNDQVH